MCDFFPHLSRHRDYFSRYGLVVIWIQNTWHEVVELIWVKEVSTHFILKRIVTPRWHFVSKFFEVSPIRPVKLSFGFYMLHLQYDLDWTSHVFYWQTKLKGYIYILVHPTRNKLKFYTNVEIRNRAENNLFKISMYNWDWGRIFNKLIWRTSSISWPQRGQHERNSLIMTNALEIKNLQTVSYSNWMFSVLKMKKWEHCSHCKQSITSCVAFLTCEVTIHVSRCLCLQLPGKKENIKGLFQSVVILVQ